MTNRCLVEKKIEETKARIADLEKKLELKRRARCIGDDIPKKDSDSDKAEQNGDNDKLKGLLRPPTWTRSGNKWTPCREIEDEIEVLRSGLKRLEEHAKRCE